jgi:hypothetical protein
MGAGGGFGQQNPFADLQMAPAQQQYQQPYDPFAGAAAASASPGSSSKPKASSGGGGDAFAGLGAW